jgi:hypothetical protein
MRAGRVNAVWEGEEGSTWTQCKIYNGPNHLFACACAYAHMKKVCMCVRV